MGGRDVTAELRGPVSRHPVGPYHPRTERHRRLARGRLRLRDASAMAIGGMIGGGIFSVLGVTIRLAGHLAFVCFVIGGLVALVTARSFAGLTQRAGRSGGPYAYLRQAGYPQLAGITSWYLAVGYVFALAVYAFTFGHYVARLIGAGDLFARLAAVGVLAVFWLVNARGVGASSITEDAVVLTKLLVLAGIAAVGLFAWSSSELGPLANEGTLGVFVGAASIFVAYEGFELLSYDYDDIDRPAQTMPRALYLSVVVVIAVYVSVTLGSQMLVPDHLIVAQREVAFAAVGQRALGGVGRWLATGAAVLATSSAINATLFSTGRLIRDLSDARELPARLGGTSRGLPVTAMWMLAAAGAFFAMLPRIDSLVALGSVTFLGVFGLINHLYARVVDRRLDRVLGHLGSLACTAAIVVVVVELATADLTTLGLIGGSFVVVAGARVSFVRRMRSSDRQR